MALLFVYGSLRKDMWNNEFLCTSTYLGKAHTRDKYLMLVEGRVPYLTSKEEKYQVQGEVYFVDTPTLQEVDNHEGNEAWYDRGEISVILNNTEVKVQTYYNNNGEGIVCPYGDFVTYLANINS